MKKSIAQINILVFKIDRTTKPEPLFLLLKNKRSQLWQLVVGSEFQSEKLNEIAMQELKDKTGITEVRELLTDVHAVQYETPARTIKKEYYFAANINADTAITLSKEHTGYKWQNVRDTLKLLKNDHPQAACRNLYVLAMDVVADTQGQLKFKLLSRDFRRNTQLKKFFNQYKQAKTDQEKKKLTLIAAEKLGLNSDELEEIKELGEKLEISLGGTKKDMCKINNRFYQLKLDELLEPAKANRIGLRDEADIIAYPLSIDISRFATIKDILAFVQSHSIELEGLLAKYKNKAVPSSIQRRKNENRDNMIYRYWEKRNKAGVTLKEIIKELNEMDNKKYPGGALSYVELQQIIRRERDRRNKQIL